MREKFWEHYSLDELNAKEWEALCDGCGQCCLVREVGDNQVTVFNITCELLDIAQSRCSDYDNRFSLVSHCHQLTPENIPQYNWLPNSCAYRRIHKGEPLADWHPLLTGTRQQMREQGITVSTFARPATEVPRHKRHQHIIKTKSI